MCLAIPGRVESIEAPEGPAADLMRTGTVAFGEVRTRINLAFVPEARVGDWVLAHVGVAIAIVDASEAERSLAALAALALDGDGGA